MRTTILITTPAALATSALSALALLGLSACSPQAEAEPSGPIAEDIVVHDVWVKAAEEGMSAAFGTLENTGTGEAVVTAAASPASSALELHETVENEAGEMMMRQKESGFAIAPGQCLELQPGGNHIMLMDLGEPLVAGDEIAFTLTFSDDSSLEFTAPVKDYAGANEEYEDGDEEMGDHGSDGHEGHDMGEDEAAEG